MTVVKNPYTEKSYHSMKFPIAPAVTAFFAAAGATCVATLCSSRSAYLVPISNFRSNTLAGLGKEGNHWNEIR